MWPKLKWKASFGWSFPNFRLALSQLHERKCCRREWLFIVNYPLDLKATEGWRAFRCLGDVECPLEWRGSCSRYRIRCSLEMDFHLTACHHLWDNKFCKGLRWVNRRRILRKGKLCRLAGTGSATGVCLHAGTGSSVACPLSALDIHLHWMAKRLIEVLLCWALDGIVQPVGMEWETAACVSEHLCNWRRIWRPGGWANGARRSAWFSRSYRRCWTETRVVDYCNDLGCQSAFNVG